MLISVKLNIISQSNLPCIDMLLIHSSILNFIKGKLTGVTYVSESRAKHDN